jgi:nonsense-mediated mRNA decay protein 3
VITIGGTEYGLANDEVAHVKDFGKNDTTFKK